jgi:hypothetical protein
MNYDDLAPLNAAKPTFHPVGQPNQPSAKFGLSLVGTSVRKRNESRLTRFVVWLARQGARGLPDQSPKLPQADTTLDSMQAALMNFSAANNLRYIPDLSSYPGSAEETVILNNYLHSALRFIHSEGRNYNIIEGSLRGFSYSLYDFIYVPKDQLSVIGAMRLNTWVRIMSLRLPAVNPNMLLISRHKNRDIWQGVSMLTGKHLKAITLEGEFNSFFEVHIDDRYDIEGLTILTPDVMELMQSLSPYLDFEIIRNTANIYFVSTEVSAAQYQFIYQTTDQLLNMMGERLQTTIPSLPSPDPASQ